MHIDDVLGKSNNALGKSNNALGKSSNALGKSNNACNKRVCKHVGDCALLLWVQCVAWQAAVGFAGFVKQYVFFVNANAL